MTSLQSPNFQMCVYIYIIFFYLKDWDYSPCVFILPLHSFTLIAFVLKLHLTLSNIASVRVFSVSLWLALSFLLPCSMTFYFCVHMKVVLNRDKSLEKEKKKKERKIILQRHMTESKSFFIK